MDNQTYQTGDGRSLKTVLLFAFVFLSVIALLVASGLQLVFNFQTQKTVISAYQQLVAQKAALDVSRFIQEKYNQLETTIWLTDPVSETPKNQETILDSLLGLQPAFRQLILFDGQDRVLALASRIPQESPETLQAFLSDQYSPGLQKNERYISPVYFDVITSEPLVIMTVPVYNVFGEYQGLILAETNLKFMWDLMQEIQVGKNGIAYVVDRTGKLIAFEDTGMVLKGENMSQIKTVSEFIRNSVGYTPQTARTYRGIKGTTVVGTYVPLETPDWAVVAELPWEEAYRSVMLNGALVIGITIVIALLAALVSAKLSGRMASSLVHLMETASRISEGERDLQADVDGPIEVARLAQAFNSMTTQLRQTLENLEQMVSERTQQYQDALNFQHEILSASATGMVAYEATGQCVLANEAAGRMVNGTVEQLLGQNYHQIESWKKSGLIDAALQAVQTGEMVERDIHLISTFGKEIWFKCQLTTFNSGGQPHLLITFNDMTERMQVENEILNLNKKLQQQANHLFAANKELEAFSYSVSHDLRAPLRAINGFTNILVEDYASIMDEEGKRVCNVIQENTQRMSQLIDDLLSFSRLSRAEMEVFPINNTMLVNSVFYELTAPEDRDRIDLKLDILPEAMGDPTLIRQVWSNLISNAIKFSSKKEKPFIEIGSQLSDREMIYFVHDNGAGFNMEYATKLFGVFQRLHSEKEFEGTGVGLAIVQRIIHRHGGRVWGEGETDQGATFFFTLPRKDIYS